MAAAQAKPPLKELGPDPGTGKPIVVKEGRFGPYVTDGETNASLRRGDDAEGLTMDRALELLAERRAKGPAPKKTRARRRQALTQTADGSIYRQVVLAVRRCSRSGDVRHARRGRRNNGCSGRVVSL